MDSRNLSNSKIVDSVRNMAISRRGGVRTRGGRLPPIDMRNIAQATGAKKVVAPKIPSRRVVKKEVLGSTKPEPFIKKEVKDLRDSRDRGRGRGSKVFLQTEGSFLAEGPAAKAKREPSDYEGFSIPRHSAKAAAATKKADIKIDSETLTDLLKSSNTEEDYEDDFDAIPPCRFPLLKNSVPKIKGEPLDEDDVKLKIKTEPEDKWNALEGKFFSKLEVDVKTEAKNAIDEFYNIKDKGKMILLQIPDCLPFVTDSLEDASKDHGKENEAASKPPLPLFERLPEGYIGKLQILKSGRKRLVIGSHIFELADGASSDGLKEVVSMTLHDDGGDFAVLGKVEKKMVLTPEIGVNELTAEGKHAIDSPGSPALLDLLPQDYILDEYEERSMIEPASYDDPKLKELISVLIEWINDELAGHRIIVKDIEEDLYDGQVLQKLLEKLMDVKLDDVEVTQSEEGQKIKLKRVLEAANNLLGISQWNQAKWNVESIHSKNVVAILHLLVGLARHFRAPIRLPENVVVNVVVVQKREGMLHTRTVAEELTSTYDDLGMRFERDAFDTLFDHAPDKLQVVKKSLMTFVNTHLNKINLEVTDLDTQFHDGIYMTLLMGLLEGYFVPLHSFNLTPTTFEQKVHNVTFAFELMMDASLPKPKARPEDIVNIDLKSTLRVLYNLFSKYKHLS